MNKYYKETFKYFLRSYPFLRKYVREFETYYNMTPEELRERNNKRFLEILHVAYYKTSFYKKFYDDAGVDINSVRRIEDIGRLPVLTKDLVREYADEMRSKPKWMYVLQYTSGTTGTPLLTYVTWPAIWKRKASAYCYRKRCGVIMGNDVCVSLRGNLDAHTTKLWVGISKTLYLSSYNLHLETTLEYYNAILTKMPKCIEGYPSSLYTFACNLETLGLSCNIPFCFTSSENLLDYQRKKIEQVFNSQIYDIYGLTEGSIKLVENFNHKGYFETPGYSINEFLEDCILTTGLVDDGFPMIRYKVNDIVELNKEKIVGINGRSNSYIYGKDGTAYSAGLTSIVRSFSNIDNAQLIQCKQGQLLVNVVSKEILSESFKRNVLQIIDQKIGLNNIDVVICQISADELIYSKGRKFNFIVQKSF